MVKSVLGVPHRGLKDWMIQRVSALVMLLATLGLLSFFIAHPELTFVEWSDLFHHISVKVMSLLVILGVLYHTWIGMWTVYSDYIKPPVLRLIADLLTLLILFSAFVWSLIILGSV